MEAVGLDLWEMLQFKLKGDQGIEIRCGIADFSVKDGLMQAQAVVLDTADTKLTVTGDINLGREALNLTLHPEPKDKSPLSLRSPIHIRGALSKPEVQLEKGRLGAKGLAAWALGVVNPLLALIPLIETGPGLDSDCGKMIQEARQAQKQPASAQPKK
jgi:AsmA protein